MQNNAKFKIVTANILAGMLVSIPFVAVAAAGESFGTVCNGPDCDFSKLILLVNKIINFLLYKISIPLVAIGFMYAGARLILYPNKETEWKKTKEMFNDIATGFGIMLGIYVLMKLVLSQFLATGFTTFLFE